MIASVADLLALWPSLQDVRRDLNSRGWNLSVSTPWQWADRDHIDPRYWPDLIEAARDRAIAGVDQETLYRLATSRDKRRAKRKPPKPSADEKEREHAT